MTFTKPFNELSHEGSNKLSAEVDGFMHRQYELGCLKSVVKLNQHFLQLAREA
jgi:hypothetical protein